MSEEIKVNEVVDDVEVNDEVVDDLDFDDADIEEYYDSEESKSFKPGAGIALLGLGALAGVGGTFLYRKVKTKAKAAWTNHKLKKEAKKKLLEERKETDEVKK